MPKGDPNLGNKKAGYLNKRSEGRLRNVWQRRRCQAQEGFLEIYHADETKPPTRVNLLTCHVKPVAEERLCFDVVSYNRTYHFQAENETDREEWMSVLLNSKDRALNQAFQVKITIFYRGVGAKGAGGATASSPSLLSGFYPFYPQKRDL